MDECLRWQVDGLCAGPCKYEMHDEQLGWEEVQAEYDALSEREKQRCGVVALTMDQHALRAQCGSQLRRLTSTPKAEKHSEEIGDDISCGCTGRLSCVIMWQFYRSRLLSSIQQAGPQA